MLYAITDIHGQAEMLDAALDLVARDGGPQARIVFMGDYVDRGPDSRGVLDRLIAGREAGHDWTFLMGNHDRMFRRFVTEGRQHDDAVKSGLSWMNPRLGGTTTLASYGLGGGFGDGPAFLRAPRDGRETLVSFRMDRQDLDDEELVQRASAAVPEAHLSFLATLQMTHATEDAVFVHAGIRPGIPLTAQDPEDLLWIRAGFLEDTRDHGRLVVHGHTALDTAQHHGNRVNLDGGAGYGRPLVPAVFEGRDCWLLTPRGRVALRPD